MLSKQLKINCSDNNNNIDINTTEFFKDNKKKFTKNQVNLTATTLISILVNFMKKDYKGK